MALELKDNAASDDNLFIEKLAGGTLLITITPKEEEREKGDERIEEFFMEPEDARRLATLILASLDFIK